MRIARKKLSQRIFNATMAFCLVLSSVTASVPFILSQKASAIPGAVYSPVSLESGWVTDRTAPSGGSNVTSYMGRSALRLGVQTPSTASSSFYQYEGLKKAIPASDTIKASLYVDSSWPSNVRAGFWGVGYSSNGSLSGTYPIIEYNKAVGGWRFYHSADRGTENGSEPWRWINVGARVNLDGWNELELSVSKIDQTITDVFINGYQVGESQGNSTTNLRGIILQNYNSGTDNYNVYWSNIESGVMRPPAPSNVRLTKDSNGSTIASGSTVNYSAGITMKWNTVPNAERYQIKVTDPDGASQQSRYTGSYYFDLDEASRYGFFGTKQGTWKYEIRTKDATTLLWSDWSSPLTLIYDNTKPTIAVTSPSADGVAVNNSTDVVVTGTDNIELKSVTAHLYDANGNQISSVWQHPLVNGMSHTLTIPLAGLADGVYQLNAAATDESDKSVYVTRSFTIDSSAPSISWQKQPAAFINDEFYISPITPEAGLKKTVYIDSIAPENVCATKTSEHKNFDVTNTQCQELLDGLSEGEHKFIAVFADAANNETTSASNTFVIDRTDPILQVNLNRQSFLTNGGLTNKNAVPEIQASDTNLDRIELSKDGIVKNKWVANSSSRRAKINFLGDGTYTIKAYDKAGNESAVFTVMMDSTLPTTPTIDTPSAEQYFNSTPILNKWSDSYDASGVSGYQVAYRYDDKHEFGNSTCVGLTIEGYDGFIGCRDVDGTSRDHGPGSTEQGGVRIWVRAMDNAGNYSKWSDPVHYFYDANAPTSTNDLGNLVNGTVTITQIVSDNIAAKSGKLRIWKMNPDGSLDDNKFYAIGDVNVDSSNKVVYTLNTVTDLYGDGKYMAKFTSTDKAGNTSVAQKEFTVDNTPPQASISFPGVGTSVKTFTVQFNEAVNMADAENPANYFLNNWKPEWSFASLTGHATASYNETTHVATVTFTDNGWYLSGEQQWGVKNIRDLAGNPLAETKAYTTAPAGPNAPGMPTATTPNNSKTINWSWTAATDPGDYVSGVEKYHYTLKKGDDTIANGETANILSVATTVLDDGTYTLRVWAEDAAGNDGAESAEGTVVVDTIDPLVTLNDHGASGNVITPNITATDANNPLTYLWTPADASSAANVVISNPNIATPTFTATSNGTYNFELKTTDPAGNVTTKTFSFTYAAPVTPASIVTFATPAASTPSTTFANVVLNDAVPQADAPAEASAVLGADTKKSNIDNKDILGATATPSQNKDGTWSYAGLNWYWWLPIVLAIGGAAWWSIAAYRRRQEQEA